MLMTPVGPTGIFLLLGLGSRLQCVIFGWDLEIAFFLSIVSCVDLKKSIFSCGTTCSCNS